MQESSANIRDLAVIGDRRTCAYITKNGSVVWYCPDRFDQPSVFGSLLDVPRGGCWQWHMPTLNFHHRAYVNNSALLMTQFTSDAGTLLLEDWMPMSGDVHGLCRMLSPTPEKIVSQLSPKPDYGRKKVDLSYYGKAICINYQLYCYASHALVIEGESIVCSISAGEKAWFFLSDKALNIDLHLLQQTKHETLTRWEKVMAHVHYKGPYEREVHNSLRMLRLMTYAENGGIIAAGTTSLPEVPGGERNYDYRFVWLRDAAMIVSALTRAGSDGVEERKFLEFICGAMHEVEEPVVPFFTLDFQPAPEEKELVHWAGYAHSLPVRIGNSANDQLQLDAISNVLLAAKLIYNRYATREHWDTVSQLAEYLVKHWHEPDHGLWEESQRKQYTSSKVVAAVSLKFMAEHCQDQQQKERWSDAAAEIREYVEENCLTSEGAYAAFAGSEAVDISAILFPTWAYTEADTLKMLKTIEILERDYCQHHLFRRYLVDFDSRKEGVFLAGSLWVAQYWVMRRNWKKFHQIMEATLSFCNDVGLLPEEGDPETGECLGNIPQTFVHASLIGAIIDYKNAFEKEK